MVQGLSVVAVGCRGQACVAGLKVSCLEAEICRVALTAVSRLCFLLDIHQRLGESINRFLFSEISTKKARNRQILELQPDQHQPFGVVLVWQDNYIS